MHEFFLALCLLLVMEGIWPFLDPDGLRRALEHLSQQDSHLLRMAGLFSMLTGVTLLYWLQS